MNRAVIDAPVTVGLAAGSRGGRASRPGTPGAPPTSVRPAWWLWPHLLSLDAPLVALVWQRWWAHVAGITLPGTRAIILALGVWLIYLADRLADSTDSDNRQGGATRHVFSGDRRRVLLLLTALLGITLTTLTPRWLPAAEFRAGLGLLALATGYFGLIHCWPGRRWAAYLPKEAAVGAIFVSGTAFFVVCRSPHLPGVFWLGNGLFAAVCFLNCALITKWERQRWDLRERSSLLNAFPRLSARLGIMGVGVGAASLGVAWTASSPAAVPVALSALLLAGLDTCEGRISRETLRVLADVVLLTPWLGWCLAAAA